MAWDKVDLAIPAMGSRMRVIGAIEDQLVTEHLVMDVRQENGLAVADIEVAYLLKMVVIERHKATGNVGKGFIKNLGLKHGVCRSSRSS